MLDERKKIYLTLALIALAAIVAYIPVLQAGFIWDDDAYVEKNKTLLDATGLAKMWFEPRSIPQYYPLVHTTYWVEYRLWKLDPLGYHFDNLLLHLTSCMLLFVVVRRLALPGAALIAAVFALHPVMVESVAWVTERKNVLSLVFYLSALLAYLRYSGIDGHPRGPGRMGSWWWMTGFFLCALASKSVTFSMPFTCLLILWWKRGRITVNDVVPLLPLIVMGAAYGGYTSYVESAIDRVGASGPEWEQTFLERGLIAGRVPWFYLYKLFWPVELTLIYERWNIDASAAWQYGYPVATLLLVAGLVRVVVRTGRRAPLAAVLMFGGTLFPAIGFINVFPFRYSYVADHFQYHASIGIIVLTCVWLVRVVPKPAAVPAAVLVLGLFGVRTFVQCKKYESREVLYNSILADVPDAWFAHNNLAAIYVGKEDWDAAFKSYSRTRELHPILAPKATPASYAYALIGSMQCRIWSLRPAIDESRKMREDIEHVRRAEQMGQDVTALRQKLLARQRRVEQLRDEVLPYAELGEQNMLRAIQISPEYANPRENLGTLMYQRARLSEQPDSYFQRAIRSWNAVIKINPTSPIRTRLHNVHIEVANYLQATGRPEEANAHRQAALRLRLEDPARK